MAIGNGSLGRHQKSVDLSLGACVMNGLEFSNNLDALKAKYLVAHDEDFDKSDDDDDNDNTSSPSSSPTSTTTTVISILDEEEETEENDDDDDDDDIMIISYLEFYRMDHGELNAVDDSNVTSREGYQEKSLPPDDQRKILDGIHDLLVINQQLPVGPSSSAPEAVLRLDTGDHPPIFRYQYPLPQALHVAVDEQIASWAEHQVIVPAPPDCQ
ncbi:hypothetical protein QOT17_022787 [Balamuthia mandrillaris]